MNVRRTWIIIGRSSRKNHLITIAFQNSPRGEPAMKEVKAPSIPIVAAIGQRTCALDRIERETGRETARQAKTISYLSARPREALWAVYKEGA